jgi:hypothetical protein
MERIFLGVFYVVSGSFLWISGGDTGRALCGKSKSEKVHDRSDFRYQRRFFLDSYRIETNGNSVRRV